MAARPAGVFPWSVLVLPIYDYSRQFASKKSWQKSFMVQNQFKVQRVTARAPSVGSVRKTGKTTGKRPVLLNR
jgi:hypothetical protein